MNVKYIVPLCCTNTRRCTPNYVYTACLVRLIIRGDWLPRLLVSFGGVAQGVRRYCSGRLSRIIDRCGFQRKRQRVINPLNAELNPICHLLALLGAHHILHFSRIRVKYHLPSAGIITSSPYSPR